LEGENFARSGGSKDEKGRGGKVEIRRRTEFGAKPPRGRGLLVKVGGHTLV
jgi:hypothetical protein